MTPTLSVSWLCGGMVVPAGYEANKTSQFSAANLNASKGPSNFGRPRSRLGKCDMVSPVVPNLKIHRCARFFAQVQWIDGLGFLKILALEIAYHLPTQWYVNPVERSLAPPPRSGGEAEALGA